MCVYKAQYVNPFFYRKIIMFRKSILLILAIAFLLMSSAQAANIILVSESLDVDLGDARPLAPVDGRVDAFVGS